METVKHDIWTWYYNAFTLGGRCKRPIIAEVECLGEFELGEGYKGYFTVNPNTGNTYVLESETGAIVGSLINEVKEDILTGDVEIMKEQVNKAKEDVKYAERMIAEEFWKRFR